MIQEYGYEYDAELDKEILEKTENKTAEQLFMGAMCLRTGRDALKVIAREFEPTVVLLPALSCESMIVPFEIYGHSICYYDIHNNFSINIQDLHSIAKKIDKTCLFLYMDYFGNQVISDVELYELKTEYLNMIFIEDRTHNLFIDKRRRFKPHYTMASLRKWVNIPDGGLLWTNIELKNQFFDHDLTFFEKRLHAQCMRHEFLLTGNQLLKTEYIKIFSTVSKIIDKDKKPSKMSAYTYEIVKRTDFDWISKIRKINVATLIETLKEANIICIQEMAGASDIYVPILVNNRKQLQRRLSEMGIFCTIIWPLNEEQRKKSNLARYIEEHMLAIYCDQRYKTEDMRYIASQIVRLNSE